MKRGAGLQKESTWVFMPGPRDPGLGGILPRPPLAEIFQNEIRGHLPEAVFASNPCRIRYHNLQIVVFRADLEARMRKLCLLPPAGRKPALALSPHKASAGFRQTFACLSFLLVLRKGGGFRAWVEGIGV